MDYPADKTYRKAVVRLTDLVDAVGTLDGFLFEGCQINGPAVVLILDSTVAHSNLGGPTIDAILWEIPVSRTHVVGAIAVRNCTFDTCTFAGIGFAGPPDFIKRMRGDLAA